MNTQERTDSGIFRAAGVVRSARVYLPAVFLYRGLSFIRGLALTWLLAKQTGQLGVLNVALLVINVTCTLSSLGLGESVVRYVPMYQSRGRLRSFLWLACGLYLAVAAMGTLAMLAFSGPLGHAIFAGGQVPSGDLVPLTVVTLVVNFAILVYFLICAVFRGLRMYPAMAYMELFHGVFYFALTVAVVFALGPKATHVMWIYVVALLVPALAWGLRLRSKLPDDQNPAEGIPYGPLAWELIRYGFWIMVGALFWQSWQAYSLWHLTKFGTALNSDTFAANRQLGQLILVFGIAAMGMVQSAVCTEWEIDRRDQADFQFDLYSKLALLGLLLTSGILTAVRAPLAMIFPHKLAGVVQILPATFLFFQLLTVLAFLSLQFMLVKKMYLMSLAWLAGVAANVGLCFAWIRPDRPYAALTGAADAAAWSCLPAIVVVLLLIRRERRPVSFGLVVIILASFLLLLPISLALAAMFALLVWALLGSRIFDDRQRALMIDRIVGRMIR